MSSDVVLQLRDICKRFGGVLAVDRASLEVRRGEIRGLVGANGAGKSTLMRIVAGALRPDSGEIHWSGRRVQPSSPREAYLLGVRMIYQEPSLVPDGSVAENLFLGRTSAFRRSWGRLSRREMERQAGQLLQRLRADVDPRACVGSLRVGQQQLVAIAKAVAERGQLLVMDEPTSALSERETDSLFETVRLLRDEGMAVIFISHRLSEVMRLCDSVTVMRDGRVLSTSPTASTTLDRIVTEIIGRALESLFPARTASPGEVILEVERLSGSRFRDVSLTVRRGEVVALYGMVGAGRTELVRAIFGAERPTSGRIRIHGAPRSIRSPLEAARLGLALLTEDRKRDGICPDLSVAHNLVLASTRAVAPKGVVSRARLRQAAERLTRALAIRTYDPFAQLVSQLSGGNQQKVILGRWLAAGPQLLILDEPTHGIDVGSKAEIYQHIARLVEQGCGVLLVSSEIDEVLGIADRIAVMYEGRLMGEVPRSGARREVIMQWSMGLSPN